MWRCVVASQPRFFRYLETRWCCCLPTQVAGEELKKVCQGADVQLKAGRVEVKGHWAGPIRDYLYGLGF